jgi:glycosyltransferase involved in cell wall biosynthesis
MYRGRSVTVVIPALNEAESIGDVLSGIDREIADRVIVADNGSTDRTAERAAEAGAEVVLEPRRGYGSACLTALAAGPAADVYVFMDGDGSDDPDDLPRILAAMEDGQAALVIGSRAAGESERGALTPLQRFGNALACGLIRLFWGVRFTDLGPFRAVRRETLEALEMADPDFGWTVEMQVKAARDGVPFAEVPVRYRTRKRGKSKVSGTVAGSFRAGKRILGYVLAAKARDVFGTAAGRRTVET